MIYLSFPSNVNAFSEFLFFVLKTFSIICICGPSPIAVEKMTRNRVASPSNASEKPPISPSKSSRLYMDLS